MPEWLNLLSILSLSIAGLCAAIIAADLIYFPQKMWIMNVVWPTTALYAGPLAVVAYFTAGRPNAKRFVLVAQDSGRHKVSARKPFWLKVMVGATHCGSGCVLGDLSAEWLTLSVPLVVFGHKLIGGWLVDYVAAYLFGILFQYFSIKPMKGMSRGQGIWAAIKADTLSLTAWQIGMYGWMAIAIFLIFGHQFGKTTPVFWFMMQVAMLCGFCTAYPVNWWLIRTGIKEAM